MFDASQNERGDEDRDEIGSLDDKAPGRVQEGMIAGGRASGRNMKRLLDSVVENEFYAENNREPNEQAPAGTDSTVGQEDSAQRHGPERVSFCARGSQC